MRLIPGKLYFVISDRGMYMFEQNKYNATLIHPRQPLFFLGGKSDDQEYKLEFLIGKKIYSKKFLYPFQDRMEDYFRVI